MGHIRDTACIFARNLTLLALYTFPFKIYDLRAITDFTYVRVGGSINPRTQTHNALDSPRYHALRIGPFADVYEWLTSSHLEKGDYTAALASAERANEIFVGWGRPYGHYARVLAGLNRRWAFLTVCC